MQDLYLVRSLGGLAAENPDAQQALRRIPLGTTVRCRLQRDRSLPQLRAYWAMCQLVAENRDDFMGKNQVDYYLRLKAGHVDRIKVMDTIVEFPRDINMGDCPPDEFNLYFTRATDIVMHELLPGVREDDLQREIKRQETDW